MAPTEYYAPNPLKNDGAKLHNGKRVYIEHTFAQVTGGLDFKKKRTLINSYNLAVLGPITVEDFIRKYVEDSVKKAAAEGVAAAYATSTPEPATRVAAGWTAFKQSLARRTDAETASALLDDLAATQGVSIPTQRREKLIAAIGTYFANHIHPQAA